MAVEVGFEPTHVLHVYLLSRQFPLTSWVLYHVNIGMKKGHLIRCPFHKNCMQEGVYSRVDFVIRSHLQFIDTIIIKRP